MTVLITGAAGFIGFHLTKRLLEEGNAVVGIDNLNSYYDPNLKKNRVEILRRISEKNRVEFSVAQVSLQDHVEMKHIFETSGCTKVVNLAAQAGVRYSIENPSEYIQSNLVGFSNVIENCRQNKVEHLIYASSSSVYGGNTKMPFKESQSVDHPVSLYAATKKSNELIAHSYSHLYGIPTTGLRFFTVYGPWGRPDMALFLFTKAILNGTPIQVFNNGNMVRDFTYVDDIIESIYRLLFKEASPDPQFDTDEPNPCTSWAPYRIFNIGNSSPIQLMQYLEAIENTLGIKAIKEYLPMQPGDVPATSADTSALEEWIGFRPKTTIQDGVNSFVQWYRDYYGV